MPRLGLIALFAASTTVSWGATVDFGKNVFPVLQRACFECHGEEVQKGELRLDIGSARHLEVGSELLRRVGLPKDDTEAMPKRGERLTAAEVGHLREWIETGAQWPEKMVTVKHWSYVPPQRPALPVVQNQGWMRNEIDAFILARLESENIKPGVAAGPETLIRRLSLDLTGLPPTPQAVDEFVKACDDGRGSAVEALVDRLLKSPQFGVRWARPWLDLARYADSHGFQRDDLREIWAYRDWVVNALNANMRFDQFTLEQIAGDLLPNATPEQVIATGFNRCTPTNVEAGTEPEESRINQVIDRVNTTGAVWLGSTLECAQCHNHKYDPFSQRDYYSLLAYYNNTEKEAERTNPKTPGSIQFNGSPMKLPDAEADLKRKELTAQAKALEQQIAALEAIHRETNSAANTGRGVRVLKPAAFTTESDAESELQADGSVLLTGPVPETDTYTFEAELPGGIINGVLLETLTHPSIEGDGPGRGGASRPNFVLHTFDCTLTTPDGKTQALTFNTAHADYSQRGYDVSNLLSKSGKKAWAIGQRFHEPHWAAFELEQAVNVPARTKLSIRMEQNFGKGLVMGCLRISSITGDVVASLPAVEEPGSQPKAKAPKVARLEKQKTALQKQIAALDALTTEVMRELPQPRMTAMFKRGVYTDLGEWVTAGTPAVFDSKAVGPQNRVTLAKWLMSRENPLVARVTVNRWWAELFGQGIVTTLEDFGIKGAAPSHPELLDWLAVEFMDSGWDMKHVIKKLVLSAAYQQSSAIDDSGLVTQELDPGNRWLWHGPRFRLDAEAIRDNALAIAGLLNLKQGGVPIRPPQPDGLWQKVEDSSTSM